METNDKFNSYKENILEENKKKYKDEVTSKYGKDSYDESVNNIKGMSEEMVKKADCINREMMKCLKNAYNQHDFTCKEAQKAVKLHKEWLCIFYPRYTKEYHLGLAEMYVEDKRFAKNYEVIGKNGAQFFKEAIIYFLNQD